MPKRMSERYNVERIRFVSGELRHWPNTGRVPLSDIINGIVPDGSIFHLLNDIPDDSGLELTILIDGQTVVYFELPWLPERSWLGRRKDTYLAGGTPYDVKVWTLADFRRDIGQGKYRILVDHAEADARRILNRHDS